MFGAVEIEAAGELLPIRRRRERCLLGVLLLEVNRPVPPSRLIDLLWEGTAPANARRMLSSHISRIRSLLAGSGHEVALVSTNAGYQLRADPVTVDAQRFRQLLRTATGTGGLPARIHQLTNALALWRGAPLGNAASDRLRDRLCADLQELRLTALEELIAARLEWGGEPDPAPELTRLAREHPARERLVGLCMRALASSGRRVEALTAYEQTRVHLGQTLGVTPGPELRRLHQQVLREMAGPAAAAPTTSCRAVAGDTHGRDARPARQPVPPRQLPRDVPGFTGRGDYLRALDRLLRHGQCLPALSTIDGPAGVGKTALALHWAHRVRHHFPDGQLYLDLRGHSVKPPLAPSTAIGQILAAQGFDASFVPSELEQAAGLLRTALAGKRVLILLDNAAGPEQVRPLLPGEGRSLVVITSRVQLTGLVAREGAKRVALAPMSRQESVRLLTVLLRPVCSRWEPSAVEQLAALCGGLPLALRVASASIAAQPDRSVARYLDRLRQRPAHRRLTQHLCVVGGDVTPCPAGP